MRIASLTLWLGIALMAVFVAWQAGRAYDNIAHKLTPNCSAGVCVAPKDSTP